MAGTPASSRGLASPVTTPVTFLDALTLDPTDPAVTALTINPSGDQTTSLLDITGETSGLATFDRKAALTLSQGAVDDSPLSVGAKNGATADLVSVFQNFAPFATYWRLNKNGYMGIQTHAAPADAEIASGECYLWFDQTNGAGNTKLMAKGKSADGTVKTATIVLA